MKDDHTSHASDASLIETLEPRRLFDATLHTNTGVLDVAGTGGADSIIIRNPGNSETGKMFIDVTTNGAFQQFDADQVKSIKVSSGSGPDSIDAQTVAIGVTLDGGKGDDTLIGGVGADKLIAGGGSNSLSGGNGGDLLVAGLQADTISGDDGNDRIIPDNTPTADDILSGGTGQDTVDYSASSIAVEAQVGTSPRANAANDIIDSDVEIIIGSRFADTISDATKHPLNIFGNDGNDTLTGGSGNDTLDGGAGKDSLLGQAGNDHFKAKDGEVDTIDGGSGADIVESSDTLIIVDVVTNV